MAAACGTPSLPGPAGSRHTCTDFPLATSQTRTVLSSATVTACLPSGVNRAAHTGAVCPWASKTRKGRSGSWALAGSGGAGPLSSASLDAVVFSGDESSGSHFRVLLATCLSLGSLSDVPLPEVDGLSELFATDLFFALP